MPKPYPCYRGGAVAISLLLALPMLPASAADSDFRVFSSFTLQEKTLQMEVVDIPINSGQTTYNFSLGGASGRFYAIAEMERPFSKDEAILIDPANPREMLVDRRDTTFTLGYNVWRSLSVFGGSKSGTTNILIIPTVTSEVVELEYREKGGFIGASYGFNFERGQLGLSVAYADMPTTLSQKNMRDGTVESTDGTTKGTSYGVKWTGTFTEDVDYSIGYKRSNYRFDDKDNDIDNDSMDTDQTYKTFFVGLSKVF